MIIKTWQTANWGDAINDELIRLISGSVPDNVKGKYILDKENYLVVGSIIHFCDTNSIVWGSGVLDEGTDFKSGQKPKKVFAVRGPKTRAHLLKYGIDCPEVYGDPALLFPRFYRPKVEKKHKIGIVPHWDDRSDYGNAFIIPAMSGTYEFIDAINSCEEIHSSSLHGLICADAYGIPSKQIKIGMNQFKFDDYFESRDKVDLDKLLSVCPFRRKVVISPFSRKMRNGNLNPKDYPYWRDLISKLRYIGCYITQIGYVGEENLGADEARFGLSLDDLKILLRDCSTWISVDNFLQHLCHHINKPGIVIFSKSDPNIFGYSYNKNILKDRKFLKPLQFQNWEECKYEKEAFVEPEEIIKIVLSK